MIGWQWWTVYFSWLAGGGYRHVFAPDQDAAGRALVDHAPAFGVRPPAGMSLRVSAVTRYVGRPRPVPRLFGRVPCEGRPHG